MEALDYSGLDCAFLEFIGTTQESQRQVQAFYTAFFAGSQRVLDLGCGTGDFVRLLADEGIEAVGVDLDPQCCEKARGGGGKIVCQDVFDYLRAVEPHSFDGVFSAHLVEHLPHEQVLELFRLSHRALRPEGRIVVATPDVRGLFSHLEMFYLHFGHVAFYHPRLLCFFLDYVGFQGPTIGENPHTASPLLAGMMQSLPSEAVESSADRAMPRSVAGTEEHPRQDPLTATPEQSRPRPTSHPQAGSTVSEPSPQIPPLSIQYRPDSSLSQHAPLRQLKHRCSSYLVQRIVRPYLDRLVTKANQRFSKIDAEFAEIDNRLSRIESRLARVDASLSLIRELDGPFECYVSACKSPAKTGG